MNKMFISIVIILLVSIPVFGNFLDTFNEKFNDVNENFYRGNLITGMQSTGVPSSYTYYCGDGLKEGGEVCESGTCGDNNICYSPPAGSCRQCQAINSQGYRVMRCIQDFETQVGGFWQQGFGSPQWMTGSCIQNTQQKDCVNRCKGQTYLFVQNFGSDVNRVSGQGKIDSENCLKNCGATDACMNSKKTTRDNCINNIISPTRYGCSAAGACVIQSGGPYTTSNCNNACVPPTRYGCSAAGACVIQSGGAYTTSNCNNACTLPAPKYKCNRNSCVQDASGSYTSSTCNGNCPQECVNTCTTCENNCGFFGAIFSLFGNNCRQNCRPGSNSCNDYCGIQTTRYGCNQQGQCVAQSGGAYTTSNCNNACSPPTCTDANWNCNPWGSCSAAGTRTRSCTKVGTCTGGVTPAQSENCQCSAAGDWNCGAYGECIASGSSGTRTRSCNRINCVGDGGRPAESETCTPTQTCTGGNVILYEHADYGGSCLGINLNENYADLRNNPLGSSNWNDKTSSIKVQTGFRAKVYQDINYQNELIINGDDNSLVDNGWNDQTSSIRVESVVIGTGLTETPIEYIVTIQSSNGKYTAAEDAGANGEINANRDGIGEWEKFTLVDLNGGALASGDKVQIKIGNYYFTAVDGGGGALLSKSQGSVNPEFQKFIIEKLDSNGNVLGGNIESEDTVVFKILKNGQAKYMVAEEGGGKINCVLLVCWTSPKGNLNINRDAVGGWEKFTLKKVYKLNVQTTGAGSGTVSGTGINCLSNNGDCSENYHPGTVLLTATQASGSTFNGWGGDCTGMTCSLITGTMPFTGITETYTKSVIATFNIGQTRACTESESDYECNGVTFSACTSGTQTGQCPKRTGVSCTGVDPGTITRSCAVSTVGSRGTIPTDGLILQYYMDEKSGNLIDTSGRNRNSQFVLNLNYDLPGKINTAVGFSNDKFGYLRFSQPENSATLAFWLKLNSASSNLNNMIKIGGNNEGISIKSKSEPDNKAKLRFFIRTTANTYYTDEIVNLGEWNFITLRYSGNELASFINAVKKQTTTADGTITYGGDFFYFGGGGSVDFVLDELNYYSRALTDNEVSNLYNSLGGQKTITITKTGNGRGSVTSSSHPTALACVPELSTCTPKFDSGTTNIILNAQEESGHSFNGWVGCPSSNEKSCTINSLNSDLPISVEFTQQTQTRNCVESDYECNGVTFSACTFGTQTGQCPKRTGESASCIGPNPGTVTRGCTITGINNGLIFKMSMDENPAIDSSSNPKTVQASTSNTIVYGQDGKVNKAVRFNGIDSTLASSFTLPRNSLTVAFWFKTTGQNSNTNTDYVIVLSPWCGFSLYDGDLNNAQNQLRIQNHCRIGGVTKTNIMGNVNLNEWNLAVMGYDGTKFTSYLNPRLNGGVLIGISEDMNGEIGYSVDEILIGSYYNYARIIPGTGVSEFTFNGLIDEVQMWDRALTDSEIISLNPCTPNWQCGAPYGECIASGSSGTRTKSCNDLNSCGETVPTSMTTESCTPTKYACNTQTGQCSQDNVNGQYFSLTDCSGACVANIKYKCDTASNQCVTTTDTSGITYTTLASCNSACISTQRACDISDDTVDFDCDSVDFSTIACVGNVKTAQCPKRTGVICTGTKTTTQDCTPTLRNCNIDETDYDCTSVTFSACTSGTQTGSCQKRTGVSCTGADPGTITRSCTSTPRACDAADGTSDFDCGDVDFSSIPCVNNEKIAQCQKINADCDGTKEIRQICEVTTGGGSRNDEVREQCTNINSPGCKFLSCVIECWTTDYTDNEQARICALDCRIDFAPATPASSASGTADTSTPSTSTSTSSSNTGTNSGAETTQ